jgi:hypothetical protein
MRWAFGAYNARSPGFGLADLVITTRPDFTIAGWKKTQFGSDKERLDADAAELGE